MAEFLDLERFTLQSYIGEGAFGKVYKVTENKTGEIFAAKISKNILNENQSKLMIILQREVGIISQLNHPSILKFIGYSPNNFNKEMYPVIITEYSSNGSLDTILNLERNGLSPPLWNDTKKLINIFGIASAMEYLHSHNIIHRDLKPANILEDEFLFPKIADFGLSKTIHNRESMTIESSAGLKGTPIYTAPECFDDKYTQAVDVYAFSYIVYEIITLEIPFKGYSFMRLTKDVILNGNRPEFTFPVADCYVDLISRCWAQNPDDRPTFKQIVYELKNNSEFITDMVDKVEYEDYINLIDSLGSSFDPSKKFKRITLQKVSEIDSNNTNTQSVNSNNINTQSVNSNNSNTQSINSNNSNTQSINSNNSNTQSVNSYSSNSTENEARIHRGDYKIVVFGSGGCNKSAFVIQFVQGYFITDYDPGIEDAYKRVIVIDGTKIQLDILDTASQDDFAPMRVSYMRQGKGFIIMYSIDDRNSFEEVEVYYRDLMRVKGDRDVPLVICGELTDYRIVSKAEGEELAKRLNAGFFEISAYDNINVDQSFIELSRRILEKEKKSLPPPEQQPKEKKKKKLFSFFKKKKH